MRICAVLQEFTVICGTRKAITGGKAKGSRPEALLESDLAG
jgi:hypothetical protein